MTQRQTLPVDARGQSLSPAFLHDLRTPLNQILGYSEILTEQAVEEGQSGYLADLQQIHTAGLQLLALLTSDSTLLPKAPPQRNRPTTTVTSDLPEVVVATRRAASDTVPGSATLGSILVVDDSKTNRDILSYRLERQGYRVAKADSGPQALETMRGEEFDLVLLDIMMPEMDGFAVLQQLKADEALRHIPIIMISALEELESVVRCIEMGAEDYLPKPSNPTLFKARIEACLEKKHTRDREASLFHQLQQSHERVEELEKLLNRAGLLR